MKKLIAYDLETEYYTQSAILFFQDKGKVVIQVGDKYAEVLCQDLLEAVIKGTAEAKEK